MLFRFCRVWLFSFKHCIISSFLGVLFQMVSDKQRKESAPPVISSESGSGKTAYFLAEVCNAFYWFTNTML